MITNAVVTVANFWSRSCCDYSSCGDCRVTLITASVITATVVTSAVASAVFEAAASATVTEVMPVLQL